MVLIVCSALMWYRRHSQEFAWPWGTLGLYGCAPKPQVIAVYSCTTTPMRVLVPRWKLLMKCVGINQNLRLLQYMFTYYNSVKLSETTPCVKAKYSTHVWTMPYPSLRVKTNSACPACACGFMPTTENVAVYFPSTRSTIAWPLLTCQTQLPISFTRTHTLTFWLCSGVVFIHENGTNVCDAPCRILYTLVFLPA